MGEFSKMVGDEGEHIVENFLHLFGWKNLITNNKLDCHTQSHGTKTHGADALSIYESPLEFNTLENIVVSSKFSASPYQSIPSTFKAHFKDIAQAVECYSKSKFKNDLCSNFSVGIKKNYTGVLFYINNDTSPDNQTIYEKIKSIRLDASLKYKTIHVVDNKTASFLYSSIGYVKNKFGNDNVNFFYQTTSMNVNQRGRKHYSSLMPVEYITSPVIPMLIKRNGENIFCLITSEPITDESVELLTGLARDINSDLPNEILLLFPRYNRIEHKDIVDRSRISKGLDITFEIGSYNETYAG